MVTVGDQNVAASLRIANGSLGDPAENQPLTLTSIQLDPSCDVSTFPCPQHEPNVFCIDGQTTNPCPTPSPTFPQPIGRGGTACAGVTFNVVNDSRTGTVSLVPNTPTGTITLGPAEPGGGTATCIIDFTFDVGRPADDQTFAVAGVTFTSPLTPDPILNTGNTPPITVNQATLALATVATPQGDQKPPGQVTTFDTATLTATVPEANPTGTVTVRLVGPTPPATAPARSCPARK